MSSPRSQDQESASPIRRLLIDLAKPDYYERHPFRLLEIPTDATIKDLTKRRQIMEAAARNQLMPPPGPARWFPRATPPDDHEVREAGHALQDMTCRFIHEFLWIWPLHPGQRDEALQALAQGDAGSAIATWERVPESDSAALAAAQHNFFIFGLFGALEKERQIFADPGMRQESETAKALERWQFAWPWLNHLLADQHPVWLRLADRIRDLKDPTLTRGAARSLAQHLPVAIALMHLRSAMRLWDAGMSDYAWQSLQSMTLGEAHAAQLDEARRMAAEPVRKALADAGDAAEKEARAEPKKGAEIAERFLKQAVEMVAKLDAILPAGSAMRVSAHDSAALAGLTCVIQYGNNTKDWKTGQSFLDYLRNLAEGEAAKLRIQENLTVVEGNLGAAELTSKCWICGEREAEEAHAMEMKLHGDVNKEFTGFNQYRLTWRHGTIKVPRCSRCRKAADAVGMSFGCGCLGLIAAIILGVIVANNESRTQGWQAFGVMAVVSIVVGILIRISGPKEAKRQRPPKDYPPIKELLAKGWAFGEKPPAAN